MATGVSRMLAGIELDGCALILDTGWMHDFTSYDDYDMIDDMADIWSVCRFVIDHEWTCQHVLDVQYIIRLLCPEVSGASHPRSYSQWDRRATASASRKAIPASRAKTTRLHRKL